MRSRKFLQIWDITCSSATLASYMSERGWKCKVLYREQFHKHDCKDEFDDYILVPGRALNFYLAIPDIIFSFGPDVILIRQMYEIVPLVRILAPFTPIIIQFHGNEVRYRGNIPWQANMADVRISSTKDISMYGEYFGTPIHPMFVPAPPGTRRKGKALFIGTGPKVKTSMEKAIEFAEKNNLNLDIINRTKGEKIPHHQMPEKLSQYEWYLDLKGLTSRTVLSKTAIEFLHTSNENFPGKVLTDTGEIVTDFSTTNLKDYYELIEGLVK